MVGNKCAGINVRFTLSCFYRKKLNIVQGLIKSYCIPKVDIAQDIIKY